MKKVAKFSEADVIFSKNHGDSDWLTATAFVNGDLFNPEGEFHHLVERCEEEGFKTYLLRHTHKCECYCGCKKQSDYKFCSACHWDLLEGIGKHKKAGVIQIGPLLIPDV
jgi:hypothetical protein